MPNPSEHTSPWNVSQSFQYSCLLTDILWYAWIVRSIFCFVLLLCFFQRALVCQINRPISDRMYLLSISRYCTKYNPFSYILQIEKTVFFKKIINLLYVFSGKNFSESLFYYRKELFSENKRLQISFM